ncbi:hypothetical protein PO124_26575 [Bacillus licheniformis]|nr:hypothetical protein [Bacillus licheniformis]
MEDSAVTFHLTEEGTFKAAFDRSVDKTRRGNLLIKLKRSTNGYCSRKHI